MKLNLASTFIFPSHFVDVFVRDFGKKYIILTLQACEHNASIVLVVNVIFQFFVVLHRLTFVATLETFLNIEYG